MPYQKINENYNNDHNYNRPDFNFLIPRRIPSECGIFSCMQYRSKIPLHSSSNLTWRGFDFGAKVGLPIFFFSTETTS